MSKHPVARFTLHLLLASSVVACGENSEADRGPDASAPQPSNLGPGPSATLPPITPSPPAPTPPSPPTTAEPTPKPVPVPEPVTPAPIPSPSVDAGSGTPPFDSVPDASPPAPNEPIGEPEPDEPGPVGGSECAGPRLEPGGELFDCGDAHIFENHGRPDNRVNYIIVADGYQESELDTALVEHVENMLYNADTGMYSEIGQPYTRYRRFINVCALRSESNDSGVDGPNGNPDRDTPFDGGNCGDRLGCVDDRLVRDYIADALPAHIDVDWLAATLNANEWWNSGGALMVWSGGFMANDANNAASVAIHEGGHAFHQLADEYADDNLNCNCNAAREPNVACELDPSLSAETKWGEWMGFAMEGGGRLWNLGEHGAVPGGRYCGPESGVTRPTEDSEMNLLPYAYNMPSMQKAIHDIYEIVRPMDNHTPNDAPLTEATEVAVRLVDPEVLKVEWSIDGNVSAADSGECLALSDLAPGEHIVTARAYDDTPWVRDSRDDLEQVVEWTVVVP